MSSILQSLKTFLLWATDIFDNALINAGASAFTLEPLQTNDLSSCDLSLSAGFERNRFDSTLQQYTEQANNFSTQAVAQSDLIINQLATPPLCDRWKYPKLSKSLSQCTQFGR